MKLYVMRHGRTNYNELGLCNDDPARDVHLTPIGIQQAEVAAETLRHMLIERILVSQLPRTRQTARIINRYHDAPIISQPLLNDIRSGFDGRPVADYYSFIGNDPLDTQPPGGESLRQHKARIGHFLDWLQQQPAQPTLIVAHEETLRAITAHLENLSDQAMLQRHFANCEIVEFELP